MSTIISMPDTTKEIVLSFIKAINKSDYGEAEKYTSAKLDFLGIVRSHDGIEDYVKDKEKLRFRYQVRRAWAGKDDVCLFYEIDLSVNFVPIFGWYKVEDGKIVAVRIVFDPRPVFEKAEKHG